MIHDLTFAHFFFSACHKISVTNIISSRQILLVVLRSPNSIHNGISYDPPSRRFTPRTPLSSLLNKYTEPLIRSS